MYASSPGTVGWAYDNPTVTGTIEDTPAWGQVRMSAPGANFALIGDAEIMDELRAMDGQVVTVAGSYSSSGYRVTAWAPGDATPGTVDPGGPGGDPPPDDGTGDNGNGNGSGAGNGSGGISPELVKYGATALLGLGLLLATNRRR